MSEIKNGGYDDGYKSVACFWGKNPGSLVASYLKADVFQNGRYAVDLGCGEGKNAAALASYGYCVDAVDCSSFALTNGQSIFTSSSIRWHKADARLFPLDPERYDLVVCYGLYHCFQHAVDIARTIDRTKKSTKRGGYHLLCVFNDRSQDLSAHPGFLPTLLDHRWYVNRYSDWEIISHTDTDLFETHPHNGIPHHHSLTRLIARRTN
jgi:tellurite methyltransferase